MLKINSLSVGNYVIHKGNRIEYHQGLVSKLPLASNAIDYEERDGEYLLDVEGIPLTQEQFERLGFMVTKAAEDGREFYRIYDNWCIQVRGNVYTLAFISMNEKEAINDFSQIFSYVHELQNFYKGIARDDLKYKH
ncbi:hypothetical protein [Chitinophaga sp.]|uniref:hypothetical protein n=1 Tax=Chitinophaga sp. TaxID=1869181 RepID=UPI0031D96241